MKGTSIVVTAVFVASLLTAPRFEARFVLPPQDEHVHSSSIVELPSGDLFAVWYRGSGERRADDVRLEGARLARGGIEWSAPFPVADSPGFPDCNPVTFLDGRGRLWVAWPAILDNRWESALLRYRSAPVAGWAAGAPPWNEGGVILLRPDNLKEKLEPFAKKALSVLAAGRDREEVTRFVERLSDPLYNRLGWMPRNHVLRLPAGRLLLPLYSDTYNVGLVAISDDEGSTWRASDPIVSLGGVQPSLVRKRDGTIAAWMRDNGPPPQRALTASSPDGGVTWSVGEDSAVPNPGSSLEVVALADGSWLLVSNDTESGRARLSAWLSRDEGRSWPFRRAIEDTPGGSYSYPSVLQSSDGLIHVTYSYVEPAPAQGAKRREAIKHVVFEPGWVSAPGEPAPGSTAGPQPASPTRPTPRQAP
jgi:predicted neuraminidase